MGFAETATLWDSDTTVVREKKAFLSYTLVYPTKQGKNPVAVDKSE